MYGVIAENGEGTAIPLLSKLLKGTISNVFCIDILLSHTFNI